MFFTKKLNNLKGVQGGSTEVAPSTHQNNLSCKIPRKTYLLDGGELVPDLEAEMHRKGSGDEAGGHSGPSATGQHGTQGPQEI